MRCDAEQGGRVRQVQHLSDRGPSTDWVLFGTRKRCWGKKLPSAKRPLTISATKKKTVHCTTRQELAAALFQADILDDENAGGKGLARIRWLDCCSRSRAGAGGWWQNSWRRL